MRVQIRRFKFLCKSFSKRGKGSYWNRKNSNLVLKILKKISLLSYGGEFRRMRAWSLLLLDQKPRINKLLSVRKDRDCYRVRLVTRSKRDPCMRRDVTIWRHGTEIGNCIWPIIDRTNSSSVVQLKIRRITKNSSSYLSCRIFCNLSLSLSLSCSASKPVLQFSWK